MTSHVRSPYTLNAHQRPTVGDTKMGFTNLDHMGWLVCDGRSVSVADFGLLFSVIRYTFGGSGTTFKLPDFTGRVPGMPGKPLPTDDASPDTYPRGPAGFQKHKLLIAEMPSHNHGVAVGGQTAGNNLTGISGEHTHIITDPGHSHELPIQAEGFADIGPDDDVTQATIPNGFSSGNSETGIIINPNGNHAHTLNPAGGDQYHNNMQPTLFYGNMFIFCGRSNYGCDGIQGRSFEGFPYFPPDNQLL